MNEKQKILIVDDRNENLAALRQVLADIDAEIIEATNGNQALAATLNHNFALAILDVMMPGMGGFELAEHLRGDEKTRTIPLVFLTASDFNEQQQFKGYEVGGIDYISKPFAPQVVRSKAKLFLELDRNKRELQRYRDNLEALVAEKTADLAERIKEITCNYAISNLVSEPVESINEALKTAVDLIPQGWHYPENACARISFNDCDFCTANFRETAWKQLADIVVFGQSVGTVEVCYLEEKAQFSQGPFLEEERLLLISIARQLGVMITRARMVEWDQAMRVGLELLNRSVDRADAIRDILTLIKNSFDFDSVAIRLHAANDFPYVATMGFAEEFVKAENFLCERDENGTICIDDEGKAVLGCMCGNILQDRTSQPFTEFTKAGSFWTNSTTGLKASALEKGGQFGVLTRCIEAGYESVALIPLRSGIETVGLLQINNRHRDRFSLKTINFLEGLCSSIGIALARMELEARYKALFDSSAQGILVIDVEMDQIKFANPGVCTMLGYTEEELLQLGMANILAAEMFERVIAGAGLKQSQAQCIACTRRDGTNIYTDILTAPVEITGHIYTGLFFTDVTERKELEDQLSQAQKMESVGRLAGGVAHDFNNMLTVIFGHAEITLEKLNPNDPLCDNLREILKATERSADLTRQLLAFARRQTVEPKVLDLNTTVESMLKMLSRLIGENIDLAWRPGKDIWPVRIDPSQIDQILANLFVNARDAISGPGMVTIETENTIFNEEYCAKHVEFIPGEYVMIAVSDTGSGIDKKIINEIFEPFFTTKEMGKGTGLGLSTVYGIVKQNDGFITVYSEPGEGTTFKIYLHRHAGKAEQERVENTDALVPGNKETILVVEDEPAILALAVTVLENLNYTVLSASTPGEAIRMAAEYEGVIQVLMTDVVMPEMNGNDLARKLLSLYPHLRTLFMSGYTANAIAHRGVLDDGINFIQKPFSTRDIAIKIRKVLD